MDAQRRETIRVEIIAMNLPDLIANVHELDAALRRRSASAVNVSLNARNWLIGAWIVEYETNGTDRANYGDGMMAKLADAVAIKGLGRINLFRCRQFYSTYPQIVATVSQLFPNLPKINEMSVLAAPEETSSLESLQKHQTELDELDTNEKLAEKEGEPKVATLSQLFDGDRVIKAESGESADLPVSKTLSAKSSPSNISTPPNLILTRLSFSQIVELLKIDEPLKRTFYEIEAIKGNWSVRELKRQIGSLLYERTGLSTDKEKLIRLTEEKAEQLRPADIIRDPYVFEFVGLRPKQVVEESDLEQALLDDLQTFLLELGRGFCFEERQKRIQIGSEYYYVDLVFYHRILKCHVLIDLKTEPFQHSHPGQLNTYVNYFRKNEMAESDRPPIGLLLCTQKEASLAEYALGGMDENLFVSSYRTALPDAEELQYFLNEEARRLGIGEES